MKTLKFALTLLVTGLHAQNYYEARSLGVLPGYQGSAATAINKDGAIVGYSTGRTLGSERAFLYDNRKCTMYDLGSLGGGTSLATGINDARFVVGYSKNSNGIERAFSYTNGVMQDLGGPQGTIERGLAVNNAGHAAGFEFTPGTMPPDSAALYKSGLPVYLPGFEGSRVKQATGINDYDQVVGFLQRNSGEIWGVFFFMADYPGHYSAYRIRPVPADPRIPGLELATMPAAVNENGAVVGTAGFNVQHAFLSKNFFQQAIDLGTLNPANPAVRSAGVGINNSNWVVGWSEKTPSGGPVAFLHNGSTMIDLHARLVNPAGWQLMSANAINDKGEIVGMGRYNGQQVAFVLLPRKFPHAPSMPCLVGNNLQ